MKTEGNCYLYGKRGLSLIKSMYETCSSWDKSKRKCVHACQSELFYNCYRENVSWNYTSELRQMLTGGNRYSVW